MVPIDIMLELLVMLLRNPKSSEDLTPHCLSLLFKYFHFPASLVPSS